MMSQGGTYFIRPGTATSWRGSLPQTGNYYVGIYGGTRPTDYTLSLQLVQRIRFKEGESDATLSGSAPMGSVATYSLFGIKSDKMTIALSGAGRRAALRVSGFVDGKSYLDVADGETYVELELTATQDYIIEIVPNTAETVHYILDVKIE